MLPVVCTRQIRLPLAAAFVACTIFCAATTASAQTTAAKVQRYTEFTDESAAMRAIFGVAEPTSIKGHDIEIGAVSANGEVVAGTFNTSKSVVSGYEIFLWSKTGGVKDIARFSWRDANSHVVFVSDDGSVVIWWHSDKRKEDKTPKFYLIRWSKAGGAQDLGKAERWMSVGGVSADGSEIVGNIDGHTFRWTQQSGMQDIPSMDTALGVSADGKAIFGVKGDRVVRWTQEGGAQNIGSLKTDALTVAHPLTISANGSVAVGYLNIFDHPEHDGPPKIMRHFLWTPAGGVQDMGSIRLKEVSSDGTVVRGLLLRDDRAIYFVSPVADLVAKRQAALKEEQARAQAQAAEQAKATAAQNEKAADQQLRYEKAINQGRPAQIYSLAGDLQEEGRPDLAAALYQSLIDNFPDDPYTAKAIDNKEAARAAAHQQQQTIAANAASEQAAEACTQQCSATLSSCKSQAQNQNDAAIAKGLVGIMSGNAGMVGDAGSASQSAGSALSACNDEYRSCSAACQ